MRVIVELFDCRGMPAQGNNAFFSEPAQPCGIVITHIFLVSDEASSIVRCVVHGRRNRCLGIGSKTVIDLQRKKAIFEFLKSQNPRNSTI